MKIRQWTVPALLLFAGLATGFAAGRSAGFDTGSEWAFVQADMLAREAGVFMPVSYDGSTFRVVIRQPKGLYRRAIRLADQREGERKLPDTLHVSMACHDPNVPLQNAKL